MKKQIWLSGFLVVISGMIISMAGIAFAEETPAADVVATEAPTKAETAPAPAAMDPKKEQDLLMESFGLSQEEADKILGDIAGMKTQRLEEEQEGFEIPSSVPGYTRDDIMAIEDKVEEEVTPSFYDELKDREEINTP